MFDKWEREIEQGLTPDLEEGLSNEEKEKLKQERIRKQKLRADMDILGDLSDDYTKSPRVQSQYASKFAAPGSVEAQGLRNKPVMSNGHLPGASEVWEDLLGQD